MTPAAFLPLALVLVLVVQSATAQGVGTTMASPIAPQFAGGMVWLSPLPLTPDDIAERLTGRSRQELLDSMVVAVTAAYLDAVAEARMRDSGRRWATTVHGQPLGIDSKYIELGPLRLPTFLIALLPISFPQVNPTQWDRQRRLDQMRDDIAVAGGRQANLGEMEAGVREMRAEHQARREFQRNQRRPPPPIEDPR